MDSSTIQTYAKQYMAEETDPSFVKEVETLLANNDEKELFDRFYRNSEPVAYAALSAAAPTA